MKNKLIDIKTVRAENGNLSFFEGKSDISFEIKRVYFIYETPEGTIRGHHAHKELIQFLFCVHGAIEIQLDDGVQKTTFLLNSPSKGLIIEAGVWRTMKFNTSGSVLCVAASDFYDETDYIRDYEEFIKLVKAGYWK